MYFPCGKVHRIVLVSFRYGLQFTEHEAFVGLSRSLAYYLGENIFVLLVFEGFLGLGLLSLPQTNLNEKKTFALLKMPC